MQSLPRRLIAAVVVGVAGPLAAMLTFSLVLGPIFTMVAEPADVTSLIDLLGTLLVSGAIALLVSGIALAGVTLLTLKVTRCPQPGWAWLACMCACGGWAALILYAPTGGVGGVDTTVALAGLAVALGVIRFAFGYAAPIETTTPPDPVDPVGLWGQRDVLG